MKTWIALLRGINVGGKNKLPMKDLVATMSALGLTEIETYIQSGNVVFRGPDKKTQVLAGEIGAAILGKFGFEPQVMVIGAGELVAAARANPFPEAATEAEGKTLHLFFLAKAPAAIAHERIEAVRRQSERWQQIGAVFYLHAPEGFGDSRLAAQIERILGVPATARNWRTVGALLVLAAGDA